MLSNIPISMSSKRRGKQCLMVLMLIRAEHTRTILVTFRLIAFELIFILSFAFAKLLRFDQSSINVCDLRACD